jgi:hypothetical protein
MTKGHLQNYFPSVLLQVPAVEVNILGIDNSPESLDDSQSFISYIGERAFVGSKVARIVKVCYPTQHRCCQHLCTCSITDSNCFSKVWVAHCMHRPTPFLFCTPEHKLCDKKELDRSLLRMVSLPENGTA